MQAVTAPNGLVAHNYGPIAGWRHDAYMISVRSKLATITKPDGSPYIILPMEFRQLFWPHITTAN